MYSVYDICEYFDSYMMEVTDNLEEQGVEYDEPSVARDVLGDFGVFPRGMTWEQQGEAIEQAIERHYGAR